MAETAASCSALPEDVTRDALRGVVIWSVQKSPRTARWSAMIIAECIATEPRAIGSAKAAIAERAEVGKRWNTQLTSPPQKQPHV